MNFVHPGTPPAAGLCRAGFFLAKTPRRRECSHAGGVVPFAVFAALREDFLILSAAR